MSPHKLIDDQRKRRPARQPRIARWALCALFAAIVTLAILQFSFRHGRLITIPTYDDIGYFADGAERLQVLYDAGFAGLWHSYMMQPPHSPFETLMATSAFALFGFHEWAPYALNGLLALGYFLAADWLLRGVGIGAKFLCFVALASLPFVGMAVHEFRPDNAVALFTAIGVFLLLSRPFVHGPRRRQIWAGVWLGIAMLTKPPVFPQTLVLGFAAIFLATLSDGLGSRRRPKAGAIAQAWSAVLIPFLLIPAPHYYHDRKHIFSYIHDILFGTFQRAYELHGTLKEHLLYFLTGVGGSVMLGTFLWILLALLVACSGAIAFAGTRRDKFRAAAMLLLMLLAWLIPTVNKTKSIYFGLAFDTISAFTVMFMIGRVLVAERISRGVGVFAHRSSIRRWASTPTLLKADLVPPVPSPALCVREIPPVRATAALTGGMGGPPMSLQTQDTGGPPVPRQESASVSPCLRGKPVFPFATAALGLAVIVGLWNFQWPVRNGNANAGWENQRRQIVQGIFDTIVSHSDFHHLDVAPLPDPSIPESRRVHAASPQVLFCCEGDFNPDMLHFMAIQHQLPIRAMFNSASGKPEDFLYYFGRADFLFCCEPDTLLNVDFLPFSPIEQQLLDEARGRSEFEEIGKWTFLKATHSMYLFRRKDFSGFTVKSGLGEELGPVPGYDLSIVRWGLGPATKLKITAETAGAYEVYWRCRSDFPHQVVTVKRDGQIIGTQEAKFDEFDFGENRFPVAFTAGEHELEFDYAHWHRDKPDPMAVLFQHLNIARKDPVKAAKTR